MLRVGVVREDGTNASGFGEGKAGMGGGGAVLGGMSTSQFRSFCWRGPQRGGRAQPGRHTPFGAHRCPGKKPQLLEHLQGAAVSMVSGAFGTQLPALRLPGREKTSQAPWTHTSLSCQPKRRWRGLCLSQNPECRPACFFLQGPLSTWPPRAWCRGCPGAGLSSARSGCLG